MCKPRRLSLSFPCVFVLVTFLVLSVSVLAHRPLEITRPATRQKPVPVPDHKISWAAYTSLSRSNEVDYFRFDARQGEEIYASLSIPVLTRLRDYHPVVALIGPGIESNFDSGENGAEAARLLAIGEGEGAVVVSYSGGEPEVFFEPFTQTHYWKKQEVRVTAPEDGVYYAAVLDPTGDTGKYVLSIGEEERWTWADLGRFPGIWWEVRVFMEQQRATYVATAIGVLAIAVVLKRYVL